MFKKLKEKITEEVKISPQRFQQLTQTVTDRLQNNNAAMATSDENFFSIGEDDSAMSPGGFSDVSLQGAASKQRRTSNSSMASDISFLPRYESSANDYQLQTDLDVSASEVEDNASSTSQVGRLSKEQLYAAFQKAQLRYHKYRGRFTDLAKHYKELERENGKMKSVLVETQDKAIRRVDELKEQCQLEQQAKAHLESALRDEIDEKQLQIEALKTKNSLLNNHDKDEELTRYLNEARREIETLNGRLQEMKAKQIVFQSKEADFKNQLGEFAEREKENNLVLAQNKMELHNELLGKDAEISALKEQLKNAAKVDNLQAQNANLIEKLENLQQKCNNYEGELLKMQQFRSENEELRRTVKNSEETLENVRETAKSSLISLESKVRTQIEEEFAAKAEQLREDYRRKMEENALDTDLQAKLIDLEEESKQLAQTNAQLLLDRERAMQKYDALEKDHLNLIEDGASVRGQLANLERQMAALENEKTALAIKIEHSERNLETAQRTIAEYAEKVAENEAELKELNVEKQSNDREFQETCEARQKAEDLVASLSENLRILEEKHECDAMEQSESKLLELKNQQLEEERDGLLRKMESERKMYEELLNDNERLKQNEDKLKSYEETVHKLREDIFKISTESSKYLEELQETSEVKNNLEARLNHAEEQLRLAEERQESVELERNESKMLELKLETLSSEHESMVKKMEAERVIYERLLNDNERLKDAELKANNYEQSVQELQAELARISAENSDYLEELRETAATKSNLEEQLRQMEANLRLLEERDEAIQLERTGSKLLELKVQTLEQERDNLLKQMEHESEMYETLLNDHHKLNDVKAELQQLTSVHEQLRAEHSAQTAEMRLNLEELRDTTSAKLQLEAQLAKLTERVRIYEEKDEAVELERTESRLLEMKLQKIEADQKNILDTFEAERRISEAELRQKHEHIDRLTANLELLKQGLNRFEDLFEERCGLLAHLPGNAPSTNNFKHLSSIEDKLEHFERMFAEERDFFKQLVQQDSVYRSELEELRRKNADLSREIEEMRLNMADLHASQTNLDTSLVRSKDLETELSHLREENLKLAEAKQWSDANLHELETKLAKISSDTGFLGEENHTLSLQIEEYKLKNQQVELLQSELQSRAEEIEKTKEEILAKNDLSAELQRQLAELERRLGDVENEKQLLLDEIAELKIQPVTTATQPKQVQEIEELRDKLTKYKSLDLTNRSSIEFYESELDKMKKSNEKLSRQLDETLVTLQHCSELSDSTEIEYLRNVLYNYMLGKEGLVLARVIAAVCKFDPQQTEAVLAKEQQKQTLLGHLGIL